MNNMVGICGLDSIVNQLPFEYRDLKDNFELLYSKLSENPEFSEEKLSIEYAIRSYFEDLELPDEPTIYDYLVLSLRREKDIIATFNWDPFLYQAYNRNCECAKGPLLLFLHGCVSLGFDAESRKTGPVGFQSRKDGGAFEPTKILYPVHNKDYTSDPFIRYQWEDLATALKIAERVTIFGYSAPKTDVEALKLLKNAWGNIEDRNMEEFEIIDVKSEDDAKSSWSEFIHTHHYHYCNNYFESSLALHPRRSVENYHHWAMPSSPFEAFQDGNKIPRDFRTLEELWSWHEPLIEAEKKAGC